MTHKQFIDTFIETYVKHPENRAVNADGECEYRTKDGRKCAVGMYIPDEKYKSNTEGIGIASELVQYTVPKKIMALGVDFLQAIQLLHDDSFCWLPDNQGLNEKGIEALTLIQEKYIKD